MNKKGAELAIGTIVIIVLALVVLVVLILGFTSGWGNLWGRISGYFGGGANVDSVVQACQVACTTESFNDYCVRERSVRFEDETRNEKYTCKNLEGEEVGLELCGLPCSLKTCEQLLGTGSDKGWRVNACEEDSEVDKKTEASDRSNYRTQACCVNKEAEPESPPEPA